MLQGRGCAWCLHPSDHVSARSAGQLAEDRGSGCVRRLRRRADQHEHGTAVAGAASGQRRGTGSSWMTILSSWAATSSATASGPWCGIVGPAARSSPPSTWSTKRGRDYETWRRELLEQGIIEERDAGWMTGYFMLVDRDQVGDIGPDMNLPDPCTAIDTSYSVAIRARGLRLGLVPHVCYHTKKEVWAQKEIIHKVERYLLAKWGMFYWDCVQYTGCVLQWPGAANWRREKPECLEIERMSASTRLRMYL